MAFIERKLFSAVLIGLVVNPISGMGGSVGLKGTDGRETLEEAIRRGARPEAGKRMEEALRNIDHLDKIKFLTAGGEMGASILDSLGAPYTLVLSARTTSSAEDTKIVCKEFLKREVKLVLFAGGDGTARDIMDAIDQKLPAIGVPTGVKMHSAVFANSPAAAGRLLDRFVLSGLPVKRSEVMDIDEDAFRKGRLSAGLYGHLMVPYEPSLVQPIKGNYQSVLVDEEKDEIAQYIQEEMRPSILYILGPGTTLEAVGRRQKVTKTLLGVDALLNGKLVGKDATESELLALLEKNRDAMILVTPIGAQGFIFGRGNQQISSRVIRSVGRNKLRILATPTKLADTKVLRVDTGDPELDDLLKGFHKVVVGYRKERMVKVE